VTGRRPAFTLRDGAGRSHAVPTGKPCLVAFVKEDCPTCLLVAPMIEALARSARIDVRVVAQDEAGPEAVRRRFGLTMPVLDDSALEVSFAWQVEAVPTVVLLDGEGRGRREVVGFAKADWQALWRELDPAGADRPAIDWDAYPDWRPGCGSRSADPLVAERLAARAAGSPLRSRRIEVGEEDDPFEFLFAQGLTDGLPVVPPTPERVLRMLSGTARDPQEVVATVAPNLAPVTVEKVAINAVMAGCRPEYLPVVLAAVEAACSPEFNLHGVLATTHFVGPVVVVNGPVRQRIGMNAGVNALGQGNRANATIGRALQLVVRNVGGGRPGGVDRAVLGQPGKYTFCFAEHEERSRWEPLHVERGFAPQESTGTVFAGSAPCPIIDQLARGAGALATSYGLALAAVSHPKHYGYGEIILVVPPEHVDTFARESFTKDLLRERIQAASRRAVRDLVGDERCAEGLPRGVAEGLGLDRLLPKFRAKEMITLVVAGGEAGKFAAYLPGWVSGPGGSTMVTRRIEERL
jgi:thiol-disulfide isomerase/thioredoxin